MNISVNQSDDEQTVILKVTGRFDFSVHNEFRKAYKDLDIRDGLYRVDLSETQYLDSSALGMLLLLKEHAQATGSRVIIANASDDIKEILLIASFDKLFEID